MRLQAARRCATSRTALRAIAAPLRPARTGTVVSEVPWHQKQAHLWLELETVDDLQAAAANDDGRLTLVEYYADWCATCKSVYPNMCRIAADPTYTKAFKFAKVNIEKPGFKELVRQHQIKGLPCVELYDRAGAPMVHFAVSFRRMDQLRKNLALVASDPGAPYLVDPNGFVAKATDAAE